MFLYDVLANMLADVCIVTVGLGLGWIWFRLTKRRRLLAFFGVSRSRRIVIYLSSLRREIRV